MSPRLPAKLYGGFPDSGQAANFRFSELNYSEAVFGYLKLPANWGEVERLVRPYRCLISW
jgi:hypothetical protein